MDEFTRKELIEFASINEMITTTASRNGQTYSIDDIDGYLLSPYRNNAKLREVSDYFYYTNGLYRNIINSFGSLPTLDSIILPTQKTIGKVTDKSYGTYYDKVNNYVSTMQIKETARNMLKSYARYGGYVGYERNAGNEYSLQTLPLDYCRVKCKIGHDYQVEFNFKYFDKFYNAEDLDFAFSAYPPEFQKLYNAYKSGGKGARNPEWQILDIKKTYCIVADEDEPFFIPTYSGMFKALLNNEEYKDIVKTGDKLDVSKLVVQKIPVDKDGNITITKDVMQVLHTALKSALPDNVNGLTTPFEVKDVPFTSQTTTKENLLEKAERGAFVASGWSSEMFAEGSGVASLNINIEVVTANIFSALEKIENLFSRKFKNVANTKNYEFNLKFYRTTSLNVEDNFERMYKLLEIGGAITPLISLTGIDPDSYTTLLQIESMLGVKDLLVIPESIHTQSGSSNTDDTGGRPSTPTGDVTNDNTAVSKNKDSNNPLSKS